MPAYASRRKLPALHAPWLINPWNWSSPVAYLELRGWMHATNIYVHAEVSTFKECRVEEKSAIDPNCKGARCFATALTPPAISMLQVLTRGEEICRNTAQLHINPKLVHRQRQQLMYIAGTTILLHRVTAVMPDTGQRAKSSRCTGRFGAERERRAPWRSLSLQRQLQERLQRPRRWLGRWGSCWCGRAVAWWGDGCSPIARGCQAVVFDQIPLSQLHLTSCGCITYDP